MALSFCDSSGLQIELWADRGKKSACPHETGKKLTADRRWGVGGAHTVSEHEKNPFFLSLPCSCPLPCLILWNPQPLLLWLHWSLLRDFSAPCSASAPAVGAAVHTRVKVSFLF